MVEPPVGGCNRGTILDSRAGFDQGRLNAEWGKGKGNSIGVMKIKER